MTGDTENRPPGAARGIPRMKGEKTRDTRRGPKCGRPPVYREVRRLSGRVLQEGDMDSLSVWLYLKFRREDFNNCVSAG